MGAKMETQRGSATCLGLQGEPDSQLGPYCPLGGGSPPLLPLT